MLEVRIMFVGNATGAVQSLSPLRLEREGWRQTSKHHYCNHTTKSVITVSVTTDWARAANPSDGLVAFYC